MKGTKVLHAGWEMDNTAWAVEFEDKLRETEESASDIRVLLGLSA